MPKCKNPNRTERLMQRWGALTVAQQDALFAKVKERGHVKPSLRTHWQGPGFYVWETVQAIKRDVHVRALAEQFMDVT